MLLQARISLPLAILILSLIQPAFVFIPHDIKEDNYQILKRTQPSQASKFEAALGLSLDRFSPGKQFDINGANFTVGEGTIDVKPDEGLNSIKVGIEAVGNEAALFGGWAPVGIIQNLPQNEKIRVQNNDDVVEIELENTPLTKSVKVSLNGEEVINEEDPDQVVVFVEINEEENLKVTYKDSEDTIKIVENIKTGEESNGETETQTFEYEMDQISHNEEIAEQKTQQVKAQIKKLSQTEMQELKDAKQVVAQAQTDEIINIVVFERTVIITQEGKNIGPVELEKQEVFQFVDKDGESLEVVLTPEGKLGVRGDILLNGEDVETKEAESQLEISISFGEKGPQIHMAADENEIESLADI